MEKIWINGADGLRVRAAVGGERENPGVLLLHGGGQTHESWARAARALVKAGRYVVSADLRGHGESDWAADGDYSLDALVRDLSAFLEQFPTRPAIVGASLGGLVALTAVGESAAQLASALILVDVTPKMNLAGLDRIREFMLSTREGFASLEEAAAAISRFLPHRDRSANLNGLNRNLRLTESGRYLWRWDPRLVSGSLRPKPLEPRFEAATRRIAIPTLLVHGDLSEVVDEEGVQHFRSLLPDAEFVAVEGATHMLAADKNDAFNSAVLAFLERTARRPDPRKPRTGVAPGMLRSAMGCFATGVTVITSLTEAGEPMGFTANSFTSVSLEPPLVLFCAKKDSRTAEAIRNSRRFAVNILHIGQQEISGRYAKSAERFAEAEWVYGAGEPPILKDALANVICELEEIVVRGDHHIILGRVVRVRYDPARDPLLFHQGRYQKIHISE
jgi:flavin reductase (DIM6/NTAB) family NADH-FMN oxidoreductase RutF/pimeloyl-ACP methyl ester carboxylesterase